jgi:hypothetical protein
MTSPALLACLLAGVVSAGAQTAALTTAPSAAGRVEFGAGVTWNGTANLGGASADLTPNLNGSAYSLFDASAAYGPIGGDVRLGYRVTPWLLVGVSGALGRGDVTVKVGGDAEDGNAATFAGETLGQGFLEGRLDVILTRFQFWKARLTPYATASAGVLRNWHQGNVLIESGQVIQAGGGLRLGLLNRPRRRLSRVGVAAELRMTRVSGGFNWGREHRTVPSVRIEGFTGWGR